VLHPLAVMNLLNSDDEELQCVALGHDVVEDTSVTFEDLAYLGFSSRVIEGINAVTKRQGESLDDYKARVFANRDAMLVKRCDLEHNMDLRRLKTVGEKDLARREKYLQFSLEISARLG
jgi:(p)ppGpp synthase/HD superfamily hydrolase